MTESEIAEIGIDEEGRLYVRPATQSFPYIYRAGMEINWDPVRDVLLSPKPREWSYCDWFRQILQAAVGEYGVHLKITRGTIWSNIPDQLRKQIEAVQRQTS